MSIKRISVPLPTTLAEQAKKEADEDGRTLANYLAQIVKKALKAK